MNRIRMNLALLKHYFWCKLGNKPIRYFDSPEAKIPRRISCYCCGNLFERR